MTVPGKTVRIFLADGEPGGIVTAEIMNWSGHALVAPRSRLADVLQRTEAGRTGIYILFGETPENGLKRKLYIGESDNVGKRLSQHVKSEDKEFFERFCIITSKDFNLTKGHIRYVENRLTVMTREIDRAECVNGNEPATGTLPESDIADMEFFISQIKIILPIFGYDFLRDRDLKKIIESDKTGLSKFETLKLVMSKTKDGIAATAYQNNDEIIVEKDSLVRKNPNYATNQYSDLRNNLIEQKVIIEFGESEFLKFAKDTPFASPSAAAAVILGRNANGRTEWLVSGSLKTLKKHQEQATEAAQ